MRAGLESGQQWHRCPISTSSARTAATRSVPYITECPYCGNRLRKRAPEDRARRHRLRAAQGPQGPQARAPRLSRFRSGEIPGIRGDAHDAALRDDRARRPLAVRLPAALPGRAGRHRRSPGRSTASGGAWRPRPSCTASIWYELAAVTAIAVFGWLLERRHGPLVVARPLRAVRDGRHRADRGRRSDAARDGRQRRGARAAVRVGGARTSSRAAAARSTTATCWARRSSPRCCCSCPWP